MMKKCLGLMGILSIVTINVLQAEQNKDINPYGWWSRKGYQKEMEQYGSQPLDEKDQEKMVQALYMMEANKSAPCKYLNQKMIKKEGNGVVTKNGIWLDPTLSGSESEYALHELAKQWWEKHNSKYPWLNGVESLFFGLVTGFFYVMKNNEIKSLIKERKSVQETKVFRANCEIN